VRLICVPPDRVVEVLPLVQGFIEAAMKRAVFSTADEVISDLINERALLWLVVDGTIKGAGVTQLNNGVCEVVTFAGTLEHLHLIETIRAFAKAEGCTKLRLIGRAGWKILPGFKTKAVIMESQI
jgi:hypothetical protein